MIVHFIQEIVSFTTRSNMSRVKHQYVIKREDSKYYAKMTKEA